jgi:hypothetical protein
LRVGWAYVAALVVFVCLVMLATAARAEAVPSITYTCTPAPRDCSGWYTGNVSLEWTVLPFTATKTGCEDQTFTTDTTGTTVFCRASDGSSAVTVELTIKVDQTPPVVTGGQPGRAADVDGWYNHAVAIAFSGSDQTSGIASCANTTYGGPDSGAASVPGTCMDNAGNVSSPLPYGLKYDETAPTLTGATPDHAPNGNGWFNRSVQFDIEADDGTSGIADCPAVTYGGPDSASASITGNCRDRAGNTASRSFPLKYDATAPVATGASARRSADVNGWYNHDVPIDFAGTDQMSGIAACTSVTYSGPDSATASQPGTCTDNAGNVSAQTRFALKYDETAPVTTDGRPARAANANGWYNAPVQIAFSGTDQTSGLGPAACTTTTYGGPDSGAASVAGACTDNAGNVSAPLGFGLKYDATSPSVTNGTATRSPNANGWYKDPVSIGFNGTDLTSGIAACTTTEYGGPDNAAASVPGTCTDKAGNTSAGLGFALKYDETAPSVTSAGAARAPNRDGWYNAQVSISFTGADQTSGIAACTTAEYGGPDSATASQPGSCTDKAGNTSATAAFALKYDETAPIVNDATPARQPNENGWYRAPVAVAFSGTDGTSQIAGCTTATYGGPDNGAASVPGTCTDKAGNTSAPLGFALKYDATNPSVTSETAARAPNANGWYRAAVAVSFAGTDATSQIASCTTTTYDGPDNAAASVPGTCTDKAGNTSAALGFALKYDETAPSVAAGAPIRPPNANGWYNAPVQIAFSGADQVSGIDACTTASYSGPDSATVSQPGTCTDKAGNVSSPLAFALKYDGTSPTVTGATPEREPNANGWYKDPVQIAFSGGDDTSGVAACTSTNYAGPDGSALSVPGTCTDKAGNVSAPLGFALKYDETSPGVSGATPARSPDVNGWYNHEVGITFRGTDQTSGIDSCAAATYSGPDGLNASQPGTCIDKAGNTSGTLGFALKYDETPPEFAGATAVPAANAAGWHNTPFSVVFNGRDPVAGVDKCTTASYSGPDNGSASVSGTCTDKAGNTSDAVPFGVKYDATAPVATGATPARPPNANGWYKDPVSISFSGTDDTSRIASCTTTPYDGPNSGAASVAGTCTDKAGNTSDVIGFSLKYDETGPKVTGATAARPPDHAGWYVGPVRFDITGADATSGLDVCPPVTYVGPDAATGAVTGQCRDKAGNVTSRAFGLMFDAHPPPIAQLKTTPGNGRLAVSWRTTADAKSVEVVRSPGAGAASSVVFRGPGASFVDRGLANGVRYAYNVRLRDAAGNASSQTVVGVPTAPPPPVPIGPHLLAPATGSVVPAGRPLRLRWTKVARTKYYNVQLYRNGRKVLSAWPARARYRVRSHWKYNGKRRTLTPGRYRWMVWPGLGPRSRGKYGDRIGPGRFKVVRRLGV